MAHLFIFGLGYSAKRIKRSLECSGWTVEATGSEAGIAFNDEAAVHAALARASHVLSSVPPAGESDPVLDRYGAALGHAWLGYLSSTGVYGDTGGAWVDESAPTGAGRRSARAECDRRWLDLGARVFRLPGIYGPGRSAIERVRAGTAHRIDLPGQVFSRVHVNDLVSGVIAALDAPSGAYNLTDDRPASQNAVIEEACGKSAIKRHLPAPAGDVEATYADVRDLQAKVDFRPDTPIETGISRFVAWYREFYRI